jgi:hypothetical protein
MPDENMALGPPLVPQVSNEGPNEVIGASTQPLPGVA